MVWVVVAGKVAQDREPLLHGEATLVVIHNHRDASILGTGG